MRSNYKRLGDYVDVVNKRNKKLEVETLLGVSIRKVLMPSIANTIGTNMTTYKIIKRNQFAYGPVTSRNGEKISIAILDEYDEAIVSQAYTVFKIKDEKALNPEYLMMWFRRPEFDRYARYKSHGSAREIFDWNEMLETELPIPSIEKQQEIVKEYNVVKNRIVLNEQLNQNLEETAQALYKHWFVDFEFPVCKESHPKLVSGSQPLGYKTAGGKMVFNEKLDKEIPVGWIVGNMEKICSIEDGDRGKNYPKTADFLDDGYCLFLNAGNVTKLGFDFSNNIYVTKERDEFLRKGKLKRKDVVLTTRGTVGNIAYYSDKLDFENVRINSGMVILRNPEVSYFLYTKMKSAEMRDLIINHLSGSAQPQLPITDIKRIEFPLPNKQTGLIEIFNSIVTPLQNLIDDKNLHIRYLNQLQDLLLSKMARVKEEKKIVNKQFLLCN